MAERFGSMTKESTMLPNLNTSSRTRISEKDLVEPALLVLAKAEHAQHGPITMSQLRQALKALLPLSEGDREPLRNRNDTRVDQIIRNLVSHRTLEKQEFVHVDNGRYHITEAGKAAVLDFFLNMIPTPHLKVKDLPALDQDNEDVLMAAASKASVAQSPRRAPRP